MDMPLVNTELMADLERYLAVLSQALDLTIYDIGVGNDRTFAYKTTYSLEGITETLDGYILKPSRWIDDEKTKEDVKNVQGLVDLMATFASSLKIATVEFRDLTSESMITESAFKSLATHLYSMKDIVSVMEAVQILSEDVADRNDILSRLRGVLLEVIGASDEMREKLIGLVWEVGMPGKRHLRDGLEERVSATDAEDVILTEIEALDTSPSITHVNKIVHEHEPLPEPELELEDVEGVENLETLAKN